MMKRIVSIIALVMLLAVLLSSCIDLKGYKEVADFAKSNIELIESLPYDEVPNDFKEEEDYLKEYFGEGCIVKSVYEYTDDVTIFYCGSAGNALHTKYTGFYYSKKNTPFGLGFNDVTPVEIEPGVFEYNTSDNPHYVWTKRICDNLFYFYEKYY